MASNHYSFTRNIGFSLPKMEIVNSFSGSNYESTIKLQGSNVHIFAVMLQF